MWVLFLSAIPIATGVYLIWLAFMMKTENIQSNILFKVAPFFLGLFSFLMGVKVI